MTKSEAMQILCEGEQCGEIDDFKILITPADIRENLRCNDHELDLEYIQDLVCIDVETGDYGMFQGHSLGEITL